MIQQTDVLIVEMVFQFVYIIKL